MATGFTGGAKMKAVLQRITKQASKHTLVKVGFQDGATYPSEGANPVFVAQVAFWNEYGTEKGVPPRPFFRTMIDEKSPKWGDNVARLLKSTNFDVAKTFNIVGDAIQSQLQNSILNGGWQGNADSTIARKGFDKPLVEMGVMYRNITYVVDV